MSAVLTTAIYATGISPAACDARHDATGSLSTRLFCVHTFIGNTVFHGFAKTQTPSPIPAQLQQELAQLGIAA